MHWLNIFKVLMKHPLQSPCSPHSVTKGLMAAYATRQLMLSRLDRILGACETHCHKAILLDMRGAGVGGHSVTVL